MLIKETNLYKLFKISKFVYNLYIKDFNNNSKNNNNIKSKLLYFSLLKTNILTNVIYNVEDNLINISKIKIFQ